jgi:hypothetical protein
VEHTESEPGEASDQVGTAGTVRSAASTARGKAADTVEDILVAGPLATGTIRKASADPEFHPRSRRLGCKQVD